MMCMGGVDVLPLFRGDCAPWGAPGQATAHTISWSERRLGCEYESGWQLTKHLRQVQILVLATGCDAAHAMSWSECRRRACLAGRVGPHIDIELGVALRVAVDSDGVIR